ncbi:hypothetical protein ACEV7R_23925, partial [Vibrio parahaemolyticus]
NINTIASSQFKNLGSQFSYKHNFAKNGHNLSADYNYNNSKNSNNSDICSYTYNLDGTPKQPALLQQGIGSGTTINHTAQI